MKRSATNAEGGQVMLLVTILLLGGSMVIASGTLTVAKNQVRVATENSIAKDTHTLSEGAVEEVVYRHLQGMDVSATETLTENGVSATVVTTNVGGGKRIHATGALNGRERTTEVELRTGNSFSFSYGVQSDSGGIELDNSASVIGDVFANGDIIGHNKEMIYGNIVTGGPSGYVYEVRATGSVRSHELEDVYVEGDAYYQVKDILTTVDGTEYPGSGDPATSSLPLPESLLDQWQTEAEADNITNSPCPYEIKNTTDTISGKYTCGMKITNSSVVTLDGPVWVVGDIEIENSSAISINPALGDKSIPIIVDDPSDRSGSGIITLKNSTTFAGTGDPRSFVFLISRNNDISTGGSNAAIEISNSAAGDLVLYTNGGMIQAENNTTLTAAIAYKIFLKNSAQAVYDTELDDILFTSGSSTNTYVIDSWKEVE